MANVLIDGPGLHVGTEQTADHAYLRFHGRNYDIWYRGEKEDDQRLDRYDYLYKRDHQSVRNAFLLMDLLLIEAQTRGDQVAGSVYIGRILINSWNIWKKATS